MFSSTKSASDAPLTASTTRPSQSVLMPYSKRSPGSKSSGDLNTSALPGRTFGTPVICS
jgi:hypothetical protein